MRAVNKKESNWRVFLVFAVLLLTACGAREPQKAEVSMLSPDFFGIGEELARQLTENNRYGHNSDSTLILTTLVNLDDLSETTRFGRTVSESLATSMFRKGYGVVEMRRTAGVFIKDNGGELVLTRDAGRLAREHRADAIVAGTYSLTPDSVIINLKLLDAGSQEVLSVAGMELDRTYTIDYLLAGGGAVDAGLSGREM